MIEWYQAVLLALLQGLTEFLPISSSAHLVIPSLVFGWPDQGLAFDVAVHLGTLLAVLGYYRSTLTTMMRDWLRSITGTVATTDSRLVWYLAAATIPAGVLGLSGRGFIESELRSLPIIASMTVIFGLLLALADSRAGKGQSLQKMSLLIALAIGIAQALALVPGVSRSGATITAGLFFGLGRQAAAQFSFLLSIPVIASAGGIKAWDLYISSAPVDWLMLCAGAVISGFTAYACIAVFLRLLDRVGMMPFVYYRIALGLGLYAFYIL